MTNLNSLLDMSLDDLADLPEFKPFPAGAHKVSVTGEVKEINAKPAAIFHLTMIETMELSNPGDAPANPGDKTQIVFILKNNDGAPNEIAQGQLKLVCKSLQEIVGGSSVGEVVSNTKDVQCLVVTKVRENKTTGQLNTQLVNLSVI